MNSLILDNAPYIAPLLLGLLVSFIYGRIRPWIKSRVEMIKDKGRRQTARSFSARDMDLEDRFKSLEQQNQRSDQQDQILEERCRSLEVEIQRGDQRNQILEDRCHSLEVQIQRSDRRNQFLEDRCRSLDDQKHKLEYRCRSFEDRISKMEEKIKVIELQDHSQNGFLEEQLPEQQELAFMKVWWVKKQERNTDLIRQAKAS